MGCDIHLYVEYKRTVNGKEQWLNGDYFKSNPYHKDEGEREYEKVKLDHGRNYQLFSTLAGVRDYTEKVTPVSEPKGIPEDASEFVREENERWQGDGHTHSWLTLAEMREYQKQKPVMHYTGLLAPIDLIAFDTTGKTPNSWCQRTNQQGHERREWSEENNSLVGLIDLLEKRAIELLQWKGQQYNIENDDKIRIVFWFDN